MFLYRANHVHLKNDTWCLTDNQNTLNSPFQLTITFSIYQSQTPFACPAKHIKPEDRATERQQRADGQMM